MLNPSDSTPRSPTARRALLRAAFTVSALTLTLILTACCGSCPKGDGEHKARRLDPERVSTAPEERADGSVILSKPGSGSHLLTSDAKYLYWASGFRESAQVLRVPKKGGKTRSVAELSDNVTAILPDKDEVYIASWGGITSAPKAGGAPRAITHGVVDVYAMAMDAKYLYYCASPGIHRIKKTGGKPKKLVDTERCLVANLGVHDGQLYWIDNNTKAIARLPVAGGKGEVFASDIFPSSGEPILFQDGYAYFYRDISTAFLRKKLDGGEVEQIVKPRGFFTGFAVDDRYLYYGTGWTTIGSNVEHRVGRRVYKSHGHKEGAGGVVRVPLAGGEPVVLSDLAGQVRGVAVDKENVYWLDEDLGIIVKQPRRK